MTDLHTDVERYLRYLSVERQLSPITLLNYQRQLEAIINLPAKTACKAGNNAMQRWYAILLYAVAVKAGSSKSGVTAFCAT